MIVETVHKLDRPDRSSEQRIVIIIPTYNEVYNIANLIKDICASLEAEKLKFDLLIIDDDSPDGTGDVCEMIAKSCPNVTVIRRSRKLGLGSAYKDGIKYSIDHLNSFAIVTMDADGSHSPKYLSHFIELIRNGKGDVVIGSRRVPGGKAIGWGFYRTSVSTVANYLANLVCGTKIKDATSGFRAYRTEKLKLIIDSVKSKNFEFQVEVLFYLARVQMRVVEEPIIFENRKKGKSKLSRRQIFQFLRLCIHLSLCRI